MFGKKRKERKKDKSTEKEPEIVEASLEEVRKAVNYYAEKSDNRLSLRTIVKQNNEIDAEFLISYLGGVPDRPFYMSKETYEIFEDPEMPYHIDRVQIACDKYLMETGEYPCMSGDDAEKVSYFKLKHHLRETPPFDLYLDPKDRMVTHRKPAEKQ
ncbi:MAG: DUF3939 domain-containing protein [Alkalicoccus sp.]|uniref:DUF3939 domain-containing protein n=1 Tax=Alkalicoccus sp. TaxID=2005376 RepID=A0A651DHU1_9BACI|nr:MAG: DUF3939 domain-containing protein [Alkalicoccus sp.]